MKKQRLPALLLALLLTSVSCGAAPSGGTPSDETTLTPETTAEPETSAAKEPSGVPEGTDLEGETINIWYTTKATSVAETFVDIAGEMTGDVMSDTIYNLNKGVEDKLNCVLNFYNSECPTSDTGTDVRKLIMSDDTTYDVFHAVQWNAAKLAADGMYLNVWGNKYLSLDKPWWNESYMEEMTVGEGSVYALVGDYTVDRTRCLANVYYNKNMYDDFYQNAEGLYEDVMAGKWTWDRLREISATVWNDLDSDGVPSWDDRLGFGINDYNNIDALFYGTGTRVTTRDKNNLPVLSLNTERTANVVKKLYQFCFDTPGGFMYGPEYTDDVKNRQKFEDGESMFLFGFFYTAEAMREMTDDYGILPVPKYDESQQNYITFGNAYVPAYIALPANNNRGSMNGVILDSMGFISQRDVQPLVASVTLKGKAARDEGSHKMIDIIYEDIYLDLNCCYDLGGSFTLLRDITMGKAENFSSKWESKKTKATSDFEKLLEQFLAIEE